MSLIKIKALLSISTLVLIRSNLVFHAHFFSIIQILMTFGQIWYPTYFWTITHSELPWKLKFCCCQTPCRFSQFVQGDLQFFIFSNYLIQCVISHFTFYFEKLAEGRLKFFFISHHNLSAESRKGHLKKCDINQFFFI